MCRGCSVWIDAGRQAKVIQHDRHASSSFPASACVYAAHMISDRDAILAACAELVYGQTPPPVRPRASVAMQTSTVAGGTIGEWLLELPGHGAVHILLATPAQSKPAPCLLGLNFGGNHTILPDPGIRLHDRWLAEYITGDGSNRASPAQRGRMADAWPVHTILARGWSLATACYAELQEDRPDGTGLLRAWSGRYSAAAIAAWSWGLSRIADWLLEQPTIDPHRLVVTGHSRLGKTALLAGASDPRFAMVIPSQSGTGGLALSLDHEPGGESVERITNVFPHWFVPAYRSQTTIEQDRLLACIAPRPVLVSNASDDLWASPAGQWRCMRRAAPAWNLDLPEQPPPVLTRRPGPLGWWMRPGGHAQTSAEIAAWLDAADEALGT
jgi:hypothetical protein